MRSSNRRNSDSTIGEVLAFIEGLKAGDFSKQLSPSTDPILEKIVVHLNAAAQALNHRFQENARMKMDEPNLDTKALEVRERLEAIFTQSADPIMTLAPPSWRFTGCNPAALKLFHVASEDTFKKLGPWDLSPETQSNGRLSAEEAPRMISMAMEKGSHLFEWTHQSSDGKKIPCQILLSRILLDGGSYLQATVRDVSKEHEALGALKSKTEELNSIYLNAPLGIVELDRKFRVVRCNPAYRNILEYSGLEIIGKSLRDLTHSDDQSKTIENIESMTELEACTEAFEKRAITRSGKTLWVRMTCRVLHESTNHSRYLAIIENVTSQKERELETHTILETMADGLVIQDDQGKIEKYNPSALELLGLTESQVLGRSSRDSRWQAVHEDGSPFSGDQHPSMVALKTGQAVKGTLMGLTLPDGKKNWIKINAVPFETPGGRKVACTFSEVTELINARSEIRFVLESLKIGVWKFNPVTQELHWDRSMYEVFDLNENDFSAHFQAWESALTPESRSKAVDEVEQALAGKIELNTDFEIQTKSKGRRYISARATVIRDPDQKPLMMFGLNWDVTEKVRMKQDLEIERTKSLRNAKLASLGEMSAGIAHEINNPLAIISGSASLILKMAADPEKLAAKVESIKKACDRIARIVSGLRKFSRSDEKPDLRTHELANIIKEALVLTDIKSKRHETPVWLDCSTRASIVCDEIEIEQVLVNLINNGIDAVKNLPEKWVRVTIFEDPTQVILQISDSGSGIPEKIRHRLFDPFFTTKGVGEGTGLGLSIAKGILDEHHATISVLAEAPHTCFEIRFPLAGRTKNAT